MMYTNEEDFIIEQLEPVLDEQGVVITWTARLIHPPSLKTFLNSFSPDIKKKLDLYTLEDFERMKVWARNIPTFHTPFIHMGEGVPLDTTTFPEE